MIIATNYKMMNMKNGEKALFIFIMFTVGSLIGKSNSKKKIIEKSKEPNIGQYLNRLIEFYDSNSIDIIEDEFLNMVDFGMSPQSAFSAMTQKYVIQND